MTTADTTAPAFDPMDPHGSTHAGGHHGHTIVPWQTQLGILLLLLFFTALTVFVSQGEIVLADALGITIPNWVNIVGAMSIATVKATLVCLYFMQLRFDKALNSIVFVSCLFCVFLFLFFSMIDLGNRDNIQKFKAGEITQGGTGKDLNLTTPEGVLAARLGERPNTGGEPITQYRHNAALAEKGDEQFWTDYYEKYVKQGDTPHRHAKDTSNVFDHWAHANAHRLHELGIHLHHEGESSSAQRSRPRHGLTPGLFAEDAHGADHHDDHADDHASDHSAEPHADDDDH